MSLAITPKSAYSTLVVDVVFNGATSSGGAWVIALFQDSIAGALGAAPAQRPSAASVIACTAFSVKVASTGTTATTFKVRAGDASAGTTTFNGAAAGRLFGGVSSSSIRITEIGI